MLAKRLEAGRSRITILQFCEACQSRFSQAVRDDEGAYRSGGLAPMSFGRGATV